VFVLVRLEHAANIPEQYDWLEAVALDAKDHPYQVRFTSTFRSESGSSGLFGIEQKTIHPVRVDAVFEVPVNRVIDRIRVAHEIRLAPDGAKHSVPAG
jgi:hypothetical protein